LGSGYSDKSYENFRVTKAYFWMTHFPANNTNNLCIFRLQTEVEFKTHIRPMCITKSPKSLGLATTFEIINEKPKMWYFCKNIKGLFCKYVFGENEEKWQSKPTGSPWTETISNGPFKGLVRYGILSYRDNKTYDEVYINVMSHINWIAQISLEIDISTPVKKKEY